MKLTRKLETEVLKVYNAYWDAYLNGDMKTFGSLLDERIQVVGTATGEVFKNKKEALRFYQSTADQLSGKAQLRKRKIKVSPVDNNMLISEQCDLYFLLDGKWSFYGHIRVSAILRKTNTGWKLVHQHASIPDMRAGEGEQIATEKIRKENLKLRDAVKRRTIELEEKNRELEIESAVERVRARALAMHKSEEIHEVLRTLRKELFGLNLDGIVGSTICLNQEDGQIRFWDITDVETTGRYGWDIVFSIDEIDPRLWVSKIWRSKKKIISCEQDFNDLKRALKWLSTYDKKTAEDILRLLRANNIKHGWNRAVKLAHGRLITDFTTEPPPETDSILLKMGAAFDLAYKRFLDLQKAEAQARESEIQLALERVRARSLAMRHSDELTDVVKLLYREFDNLKLSNESTDIEIGLIDEDTGMAKVWAHLYLSDGSIATFNFPFAHFDEISHEFEKWKSTPIEKRNELFITTEFSGKLWKKFKKLAAEIPELAEMFDALIAANIKKWVTHNAYFSHGLLTLQGTEHYSTETLEIQKRFAKVFEQAYTRFLDLQKAEAQARESQIQLALERVRARTMAMQKSVELGDVTSILFKQVNELGINVLSTGFTIWNNDEDSITCWMANPSGGFLPPYKVPINDFWLSKELNSARQRNEEFLELRMSREQLRENFEYMTCLPEFTTILKSIDIGKIDIPETQVDNYAFFSQGSMLFITNEPCPTSHEIFKRFAKVFEQTYTRFLDLQKAEEQAREAKIEAALERVRSRAMAMHSSRELKDVALELRKQMAATAQSELEVCAIHLYEESPDYFEAWAAIRPPELEGNIVTLQARFPKRGVMIVDEMLEAYHAGKKDYILVNEGKKILEWLEQLKEQVPEGYEMVMKSQDGMAPQDLRTYWSMADFNGGSLVMTTYIPPNEEARNLLRRFSNVFGLAYRRFVDLKQAEAQARESQIETALEKVRSRTMAMQHSNELAEVATVLFQQVKSLGITQWVCGFCIWETGDKEFTWYPGSPDGEILTPCKVPLTEHPVFISFDESRKRGDELYIYEKEGEYQAGHYRYMMSIPGMRELLQYMLDAGLQFPAFQIDHIANFSHGNLVFITYEHVPQMHDVFKRFAKVFDQTYTRFLDLKKAEGQAREAEIELALERVRARTMAMHKSDELSDAAFVLFKQLKELGEEPERIFIATFDEHDKGKVDLWGTNQGGNQLNKLFKVSADEPTMVSKIVDAWKKKQKSVVIDLSGEELKTYLSFLKREGIPVAEGVLKERRVQNVACFSKGVIGLTTGEPRPKESLQLLERFAGVFDLAYRRFLDLQRSEAQAREAQVELALERVRARTMAMHKSEELAAVAGVVFDQLTDLDVQHLASGFVIFDKNKPKGSMWISFQGKVIPKPFDLDFEISPVLTRVYHSWKEGNPFYENKIEGEEFIRHVQLLKNIFGTRISEVLEKASQKFKNEGKEMPGRMVMHHTYFNQGSLLLNNFTPVKEQDILNRFAKVFEQSYTRFLDLQKAEAQAREARIEAALEKVRSRSLAMHTTEELGEVATVVFEKLRELDIPVADGVAIVTHIEGSKDQVEWMENPGMPAAMKFFQPYYEHPILTDYWKAKKQGLDFIAPRYTAEQSRSFFKHIFEHTDYKHTPREIKDYCLAADTYSYFAAFQKNSSIFINDYSGRSLTESEADIVKRFSKVFEQAYVRFLDLQKAEAQAREAKIEAALERTRTQSMLMQHSHELEHASQVFHEQLLWLGIPSAFSYLWLLKEEEAQQTFWASWSEKKDGVTQFQSREITYPLDKTNPYIAECLVQWKSDNSHPHLTVVPPDGVKDYFETWKELFHDVEDLRPEAFPNGLCYADAYMKYGSYGLVLNRNLTEEEYNILRRFSIEFERTYTRFLDLQRAEAQAREARIEASLERVRSKAMAMHNSQDLADTIGVFYNELQSFSFTPIRCGVGLLSKQNKQGELYTWNTTEQGESLELVGTIKMEGHPVLENVYTHWLSQTEYHPVLRGNEIKEYYQVIRPMMAFPDYDHDTVQFGYFFFFKEGGVYAWTENEMRDDELQIYRRFTTVLSLTYKRYKDLQQAESNAREAQIEAALERVRSASLSMESTNDLQNVVDMVFAELNKLDIGMDHTAIITLIENSKDYDVWVGSADANFTTVTRIPHNDLTQVQRDYNQMIEKRPSVLSKVYTGEIKKEYSRYLFSQTGFKDNTPEKELRLMMDGDSLITSIVMLDNTGIQIVSYKGHKFSESDENILGRFTHVFEQAYIRFMDIKRSEEQAALIKREKERLEKTLNELRATQKQLIQSEKMASLGELTAGIAHEIQNPLNFVNNFSDVSNELLEEMKEELAKGNTQIAIEIANDIKQNLEKILHHGKRADDIVKGMLQHSRSSSGQKEWVDINVLADEYLRLAYHGIRAKDKTFTALLETDMDPSMEKINIVPQDIGRVVLNLINNAFYAASQTGKEGPSDPDGKRTPTVWVSTKKIENKVFISVKDNGPGIPDSIREKIFQPFFTTKPTGSGTGLGLSLSYDIIKAHGGEIKVNTKVNSGTEFIVQLPAKEN